MKKILAVFVSLSVCCLHNPQAVTPPGNYTDDFMSLWEKYEIQCPYFAEKNIDWKDIGSEYYWLVCDCETEDQFIELIIEMLSDLEDANIRLSSTEEGTVIYPYIQDYFSNVDMQVLVDQYLEPNGWAGWENGYCHGLGWCDPEVLPYLFMDSLPSQQHQEAMSALDSFILQCVELDLPAIILDVRMNPSGNCSLEFMGRFADKSHPGAIYRSRGGPEYDQYYDERPAVYPTGPEQYTGTVMILVGEGCSNYVEEFAANMINFPNVVLIGDTTRGTVTSFSMHELPGYWLCSVPTETILTYDKYWIEGAGLPPDVFVDATEEDFASGIDPVLEYSIDMLSEY